MINIGYQRLLILAVVILRSTATAHASTVSKKFPLETEFGLESPMARTVRIPPAVLHQLAGHHEVQEFLDGTGESAAEVLGDFEVAPAHVNADGLARSSV